MSAFCLFKRLDPFFFGKCGYEFKNRFFTETKQKKKMGDKELAADIQNKFSKAVQNPSGNELAQTLVTMVGTILPMIVIPMVKTVVTNIKQPSDAEKNNVEKGDVDLNLLGDIKKALQVDSKKDILDAIGKLVAYKDIWALIQKK